MNRELARRLKKNDYERFFCALFAAPEKREALLALYAYNMEVAKTSAAVSESLIGMIRLEWHRESIGQIYYGQPRRHEVIDIFAPAIKKYNLSQQLFLQIINEREKDLDEYPIQNLNDLRIYTERTSSSVFLLAAEILGARNKDLEEFFMALGRAWAVCGLLRSLPNQLAENRCFLPKDLLERNGIEIGNIGKEQDKLAIVIKEVWTLAENDFISAKKNLASLAKETKMQIKPLSLIMVFLEAYLNRMRKYEWRILGKNIEEPRFSLQFKTALRGYLG